MRTTLRVWLREVLCMHHYLDRPDLGWGMMVCTQCKVTGMCEDARRRQLYQLYLWSVPTPDTGENNG